MAATWDEIAWNEAVIGRIDNRKRTVGTWIDVVPTDHIAGSGYIVYGKVDSDLAGREIGWRLGRGDDVAAMSIGETIRADELNLSPAIASL